VIVKDQSSKLYEEFTRKGKGKEAVSCSSYERLVDWFFRTLKQDFRHAAARTPQEYTANSTLNPGQVPQHATCNAFHYSNIFNSISHRRFPFLYVAAMHEIPSSTHRPANCADWRWLQNWGKMPHGDRSHQRSILQGKGAL
jgi:hypothetical protein